jgi:predicted Rossmann fold flavoprotein
LDFDVVILGGGAAGLFAAFRAAERGRRVLLVEKNRRAGVKILMSGGTRCNLTNARGLRDLSRVSGGVDPSYRPEPGAGPRRIQEAFGPNGKFLGPALRALDVDRTIELFESEGLSTKIEANGKVFPACDRAVEVLETLMRRVERSGAIFWSECPASGVEPLDEGFSVQLPDRSVSASRVVVATGGLSYPGAGTTGDGYALARRFGHSIVDPRPALVPIQVAAEWVADLKGITVSDALLRVAPRQGKPLSSRRESLLFAHFGLTGPSALDVSREVARSDDPSSLRLEVDFLPDLTPEALDQQIQLVSRTGRKMIPTLVPDPLPRRLAQALVSAASIPDNRVGPELSKDERKRLVASLKRLELPISGTLGFGKAEVTSGGVSLPEVDPETLQSRLRPGLHLIGEVLDLDGRIGGYNFQAAWSMGWLVGEAV